MSGHPQPPPQVDLRTAIPPGSRFEVPAANRCNSAYDQFVMDEPGVLAYWALCEASAPAMATDYLGSWSLAGTNKGRAVVTQGPLQDGESAVKSPGSNASWAAQGLVLSRRSGTLAAWWSGEAGTFPLPIVSLDAVDGSASVRLRVVRRKSLCFIAELTSGPDLTSDATKCGYAPHTWHRLVLTWSSKELALFVDGALQQRVIYKGTLADTLYFYRLFPPFGNVSMAMAKVAVASEEWTAEQAATDFRPVLPPAPRGGVRVLSQRLGTIHADVLGIADNGVNLTTPAAVSALNSGLRAAGFRSVRYGFGFGGADVDLADWHPVSTVQCSPYKPDRGVVGRHVKAKTLSTGDTVDNFMSKVAQPLKLDVIATVNYGSNPPTCTGGGDPVANGADAVRYLNVERHYRIKRWEIGNEQYAYGPRGQVPMVDLHDNPYAVDGNRMSSYAGNEAAFYAAMKSVDPAIQIAIPAVDASPSYNVMRHYQLPALRDARFDALVFHAYPIQAPVTDGTTLYQDRVAAGTSIRGPLRAMQAQLRSLGLSPEAIWVTEWNGSAGGNAWSRQSFGAVTPLFVVSEIAEFMRAGLQAATWWTQHADDYCHTANFDPHGDSTYNWHRNCGSFATVYTGAPITGRDENAVGLKPGDLLPAGRGFQILSDSAFVREGEHMLRTVTDAQEAPWLLTYGATHTTTNRGTTVALILINRDRDQSHTVPVQLDGKASGDAVQAWSYGRAQYDMTQSGDWSEGPVHSTFGAWQDVFRAKLPPWSVTILVF